MCFLEIYVTSEGKVNEKVRLGNVSNSIITHRTDQRCDRNSAPVFQPNLGDSEFLFASPAARWIEVQTVQAYITLLETLYLNL